MILKVINGDGKVEYISGERITLPDRFIKAYLMDNNGKTIETIAGNMEFIAIKMLLDEIVKDNSPEGVISVLFDSVKIEEVIDAYNQNDSDTIYQVLSHIDIERQDEFIEYVRDHYSIKDIF